MKFTRTFDVRFTETDRKSRLTAIALYNYLQDTAVDHSDSVKVAPADLETWKYAWILNRIRIDVNRFPRHRENVAVTTWASSLRGLYAIREWTMADGRGEVAARSTSRWILLDVERKRAVRLPPFIREAYGEAPERAIDDPFAREIPIEAGEFEKRFHVRANDVDSNQHANSACYIDWCLETVPREVLNDYTPKTFEVTYKRESALGDGLVVVSRIAAEAAGGGQTFEHAIRLEEDGTVLAFGKSTWVQDTEKSK